MNTNTRKVFTFRIDENLLKAVSEYAKQNKRSTGKQIEFTLEQMISTLKTK